MLYSKRRNVGQSLSIYEYDTVRAFACPYDTIIQLPDPGGEVRSIIAIEYDRSSRPDIRLKHSERMGMAVHFGAGCICTVFDFLLVGLCLLQQRYHWKDYQPTFE